MTSRSFGLVYRRPMRVELALVPAQYRIEKGRAVFRAYLSYRLNELISVHSRPVAGWRVTLRKRPT